MKFGDVIPALKAGKKIRRKKWQRQEYIKMSSRLLWGRIVDEEDDDYSPTMGDLTEDDWEILEEDDEEEDIYDFDWNDDADRDDLENDEFDNGWEEC